MQNFDDLDIEGRNPPHISEEEREKEEYERKRTMRTSVTAEDGTLRPVYSETEDNDIWCHICNIALFGAHKLASHNTSSRHKMKLEEWPYPVLLWSKRADIMKKTSQGSSEMGNALAPGEPVPPGMEDQITRSTTIQMSLDRHQSSPLVGLEYLLELVDNDSCEPSYTCVLCDKRGDPRTVMAHITCYNHRITYLNRHFPTISRAIMELPRTANYKRGANEISVLVAKKIEQHFGRLQPQLVDKNQFEKNKMQFIKRVYQDYHFRETPELTFMEVYDLRWVTNFEEKMAEINESAKKEQIGDKEETEKNKKDDKRVDRLDRAERSERSERSERAERSERSEKSERSDRSERPERLVERFDRHSRLDRLDRHDRCDRGDRFDRFERSDRIERSDRFERSDRSERLDRLSPKKVESKSDSKSSFKFRIFPKDKLGTTKKQDKSEDKQRDNFKENFKDNFKEIIGGQNDNISGILDDVKSLSSLSSISSSPSPTRSRSHSSSQNRKQSSPDKNNKCLQKTCSRDDGSHSNSPNRDKWDKYKEQIRRAEETLDRALKFHEKNPEKHPAYPEEWKKFWNRRYKELQSEGKDPSKHDFKPEWIEFWNKRMRELHTEQVQQRKEEIRKRLELDDKSTEKWLSSSKRKERSPEIRKEKSPFRKERSPSFRKERSSSPKRVSRHRPDSDDDIEYVGMTKTVKLDLYHNSRYDSRDRERDRDYLRESYVYSRGRSSYRGYYPRGPPRPRYHVTPYPVLDSGKSPSPVKEDLKEDLEIVGLLRLLTALEGQLGSLGPKVVSLLSKALAAEKAKPNSADELLFDEEVSVLFETVKEKLKGQLFAGMIEKMAVAATKSAIQNIAQLLHRTTEAKKRLEEEERKQKEIMEKAARSINFMSRSIYQRNIDIATPLKSEPLSVPGVGTVDKVAIAQQIAAALVAQGRSNVSQEELETLINAVVGMAEASKNSDKPVTTADFVKGLTGTNNLISNKNHETVSNTNNVHKAKSPELVKPVDHTTKMESLSDSDLKALLQSFKDLSTDEQHGLINFLKKLEATDPARVEKLRGFVNLGSSSNTPTRIKSPSIEHEEIHHRTRRSDSPFSLRKGIQNPSDDDSKWKPKLDMFADEEEELKRKKVDEKSKAKLDLSDDDDDYTFEDIYKAADKNVNESEKSKRRSFTRSRSNSPQSWSRSRSRSPLLLNKVEPTSKSSDPNAILNETKRLIANIMGDLPNKYVVKSHSATQENLASSNLHILPGLGLPGGLPNNYGSNYNQNAPSQSNQLMDFPPMSNQYQTYQPQTFSNNPGFNNGYNYNSNYNQNQYSGMPSAQYPPSQQNYSGPTFGGPQQMPGPPQITRPLQMSGAPQNSYSQQQQYGNYPTQQQRFY